MAFSLGLNAAHRGTEPVDATDTRSDESQRLIIIGRGQRLMDQIGGSGPTIGTIPALRGCASHGQSPAVWHGPKFPVDQGFDLMVAQLLAAMPSRKAADILENMGRVRALLLLREMNPAQRRPIMDHLPEWFRRQMASGGR